MCVRLEAWAWEVTWLLFFSPENDQGRRGCGVVGWGSGDAHTKELAISRDIKCLASQEITNTSRYPQPSKILMRILFCAKAWNS